MHPEGLGSYRSSPPNYPKVTVAEWVNFNKPLLNLDDVIVKVFRCRNTHMDNCMMITKMKIADMSTVFGDYLIIHFGIDTHSFDHGERTTFKFVIYKED